MNRRFFVALGVACVLMWSRSILAEQGRGHGRGHAKIERSEHAEDGKLDKHDPEKAKLRKPTSPIREDAVVIDRDGHRRIVTEYFSRESLPPGLAKRQSLPPGLRKQLRERGHLPPGLEKRLIPVPGPLVSRFPALPPHYSGYFAGRDLIVVNTRTNVIVAVIPNVVVPR